MGCAAVSEDVICQKTLPSLSSVFKAEFSAIAEALNMIDKFPVNVPKIMIYSDSLSALSSLRQFYHKDPLIRLIVLHLHELTSTGRSIEFCWIPGHVGLRGNERADQLAKSSRRGADTDLLKRFSDLFPAIRSQLTEAWQQSWSAVSQSLHLRSIKPTVDRWVSSYSSPRRRQVIITRLRVGHTLYTHGYLMDSSHPSAPWCANCGMHITVAHILAECPVYAPIRRRYFPNASLQSILAESDSYNENRVIQFLSDIKLLNLI